MRRTIVMVIAAAVIAQSGLMVACADSMSMKTSDKQTSPRDDMRKLWTDHVVWTRNYIVAATAGTPDVEEVSKRLLDNQVHIGNAIVPYYGKDAGTQLTNLLNDHILIAVDLVSAAKAGDAPAIAEADNRWQNNSDEIALFLSKANPNWSNQDMQDMLRGHLALTKDEAVMRLEKRWSDDIANFDKILDQALMMADDLSDGIAKQFPDRFASADPGK